MNEKILEQNKNSWNSMANLWIGTTALPEYGCYIPTENELHLFPEDLSSKRVLEIGCGSGHSLKWCNDRGAKELWGIDLSERQIQNAGNYLKENDCHAKLIVAPMEMNPGIPEN